MGADVVGHLSLVLDEGPLAELDETDRLIQALEPVTAKYRDTKERRESLHILRAVRLAPDLETCEAILRGDDVPKSRLDPGWAKAYGIE